MATPRRPPRTSSRAYLPEVDSESDQHSLLDRLLSMGFSKSRSEKAIATTGSLSEDQVSSCVNWLLAHVNDTNIDEDECREYILYMCPVGGALADSISKFWNETKKHTPNGAHDSFPHIRLTTFFKIHNGLMPRFLQTLESVLQMSQYVQSNYELEYQSLRDTAYKYVGLFVSDKDDATLHDLADEIAVKVAKLGIHVEPYTKHMHMSLAYRFSDDQLNKIEEFAKKIDTTAKCQWELKVYSRDIRVSSHECREVTHEYKAQQNDEISLEVSDTILTVPDSIQNSIDGWYTGFSLKNGEVGVFPGNYTTKTSQEHKTWTLTKSIPMLSRTTEKVCLYQNVDCDGSAKCEDSNCLSHGEKELKLLFIRHAERVDAVMGKDWVKTCFEDSGKEKFLKRFNLNMPDKYVKRRSINDFERDPPITEIGRLQAKLIGKALASSSLNIVAVYSSPSLRCIETADKIIKRFSPGEQRPLIRVENGLFEWNRWHSVLPTFIPPTDLKDQGFDLDTSYKSEMLAFDLMESLEEYYDRSYKLVQSIKDRHSRGGGCVLILGHAATPEVCIRKLMKRPSLAQREFVSLINKVPFCEPILATRTDGVWTASSPPIPKLWHLDNKKFDTSYIYLKNFHDRNEVLEARLAVLEYINSTGSGKLDDSYPIDQGVLNHRCGLGCVPFMEGKFEITHSEKLSRVFEGGRPYKFFKFLFGCESLTFDYKWLRAMYTEGFTGAHVDNVYMSRGSNRVLTMWTPIGDITPDMGTLAVCEQSNRLQSFQKLQDTYGNLDVEEVNLKGSGWFTEDPWEITTQFGGKWKTASFEAGDVLIFTLRWQPRHEAVDERYMGLEEKQTDLLFGVHSKKNAEQVQSNQTTMDQFKRLWGFI